MSGRTKASWSQSDEQAFQALAKQRDEIRGSNETRLRHVAHAVNNSIAGFPIVRDDPNANANNADAQLTAAMILHADELRDALEVFDSGARPGLVS